MTPRDTNFARWRFAQRVARSVNHAYAIEHYRPAHHFAQFLRGLACFGGAAFIGFLIFLGV